MDEKISWGLPLAAATVIVGAAVYAILRASAPMLIVTPPEQSPPVQAPQSAPRHEQPAPRADARPRGQIYRCTFNGSTIYSDAPCPGAKVVDVQVTEGFRLARPGARPTQVVQVSQVQPTVETTVAGNAGQCAALADAIKRIDEAARQGNTIPVQDRLRADRRSITDKMYALKC